MTPEERAALIIREVNIAVGCPPQSGLPTHFVIPLKSMIRDSIRAAVAEEREACAKLAEELEATYEVRDYNDPEAKVKQGYASTIHDFAAAIRARSNSEEVKPDQPRFSDEELRELTEAYKKDSIKRLREMYGPGKSRNATVELLIDEIDRLRANPDSVEEERQAIASLVGSYLTMEGFGAKAEEVVAAIRSRGKEQHANAEQFNSWSKPDVVAR